MSQYVMRLKYDRDLGSPVLPADKDGKALVTGYSRIGLAPKGDYITCRVECDAATKDPLLAADKEARLLSAVVEDAKSATTAIASADLAKVLTECEITERDYAVNGGLTQEQIDEAKPVVVDGKVAVGKVKADG
jgi:hypothetical protein